MRTGSTNCCRHSIASVTREQGGPLKALLSVIAEQVAVLEEDLDQLYDDQFIETCAEWVVPYIGDLVGHARPLRLARCDEIQPARAGREHSGLPAA